MAYGLKGAEMGPQGLRFDSKRRSGGGRYVRTSGGPNAAQRADPLTLNGWKQSSTDGDKCHQADAPQKRCHTLPYVALCGTACSVVPVRRGALTEAPFS